MGRCQRAITSFAILSGRVDHGFAGVMHVLFPPRARQHEESCFRADMFEPAGYESPAIPPVVTSAQSEVIDRWFSVVVKLFRTGRQALLLSVVPRRQRAADSPKSSANAPDCRTPRCTGSFRNSGFDTTANCTSTPRFDSSSSTI